MAIFCLTIFVFVSFLFSLSGKYAVKYSGQPLLNKFTIGGIILFSLWVGLRYNPDIDPDFLNYWYVAQYGDGFYEYDRFEIIPRLLADINLWLGWGPSGWFIMMGALLAYFTIFAAHRLNPRYIAPAFVGMVLIYLSFDMNVMRQGVALSVFLCALTYIKDRNWKMYLLFMAIAFGFHRSSIIWSPVYLLTYISWAERVKWKYFLFLGGMFFAMSFLVILIQRFSFVFALMNKEINSASDIDFIEAENVSSGFGVVLKYTRWLLLAYFIPKVAKAINNEELHIYLVLFLMGVVMDPFGMNTILIQRVSYYPLVIEILLYPYIIDYCRINARSRSFIKPILTIQVLLLTYVISGYFSKWAFVSL